MPIVSYIRFLCKLLGMLFRRTGNVLWFIFRCVEKCFFLEYLKTTAFCNVQEKIFFKTIIHGATFPQKLQPHP